MHLPFLFLRIEQQPKDILLTSRSKYTVAGTISLKIVGETTPDMIG